MQEPIVDFKRSCLAGCDDLLNSPVAEPANATLVHEVPRFGVIFCRIFDVPDGSLAVVFKGDSPFRYRPESFAAPATLNDLERVFLEVFGFLLRAEFLVQLLLTLID